MAVDDKADATKATSTATPATPGYEFAFGDLESLGELNDSEANYLSNFPNHNTERALAVEQVRLSRKVK